MTGGQAVCWVCGELLRPNEGMREGDLALCADPKCKEIADETSLTDQARIVANGGAS